MFDYDTFTTRNIGFVTASEQDRLRKARVFIAGVGGMGGACFLSLVRAGVGHFTIADIDRFEVSNLNRQVFAFLETVGQPKADTAAAAARRINPDIEIEVMGGEWVENLNDLLGAHRVVVNGTDDLAAGISLYRAAARHGASVIDAYTAPLPSVIVVRPDDPRPETRLGFPTVGREPATFDEAIRKECLLREIEYVLVHSSAHKHVDLTVAAELAAGKRARFSFAPMVITTGNLMAYEAIRLLLDKPGGPDWRGYFFNPHDLRLEKPLPAPLAMAKRALVRRFMARLMS